MFITFIKKMPNLLIMRKIFIGATLIFAVSACNRAKQPEVSKTSTKDIAIPNQAVDQMKFPEMAVVEDYGNQASRTGSPNAVEKKIVKEGDIRFKTEDINQTRKTLYASLKKLGGYVAEESENNDSEDAQNEITLHTRIPAKNFDAFLMEVSASAENIDEKNIRITDVTTQFIDVTTQLANKKKLEQRYLELLKKSTKISDLLEIESKLNDIRSSIESTQGQLNYLTKQVEYSSLDITFYSRQTVTNKNNPFGYKIKTALMDGWRILGKIFFGLIARWPIWLMLLGVFYLSRRWVIKNRKSRS